MLERFTMFLTPRSSLRALGATVLALGLSGAHAQAPNAPAPMDHSAMPAKPPADAAAADTTTVLTTGEITRTDARTGKLTIRHGEIANLGMPAMTMVFALQDPAQVGHWAVGTRVRFHAEDAQGQLLITHIEAAP